MDSDRYFVRYITYTRHHLSRETTSGYLRRLGGLGDQYTPTDQPIQPEFIEQKPRALLHTGHVLVKQEMVKTSQQDRALQRNEVALHLKTYPVPYINGLLSTEDEDSTSMYSYDRVRPSRRAQ